MFFSVTKNDFFNLTDTLECGQIFRYKINNNHYTILSKNNYAEVVENDNCYYFTCNDANYFKNFLHLNYNYASLANHFEDDLYLGKALAFSKGIHILRQDPFEMIISFIISQNNNIPRIKKTIEKLCTALGEKIPDTNYHAFPTCESLASADLSSFGLGYRENYIKETATFLLNIDFENLKTYNTKELFDFLISLKGVGSKVANCILLFGFGRYNVFPVDTWILKIFNETDGVKLAKTLENKYGEYSGFVQQWLYYYKRSIDMHP